MSDETCNGPECERPVMRDGLCQGHVKQRQRGQPLTPLRDSTRSPMEQAIDAMDVLMQAETDEDYQRAKWNVTKALKRLSAHERVAALQAGRIAAARRGVRMGRKLKAEPERAVKLAAKIGPRRAAQRLGVSLRTVWNYIRRAKKI